MAAASLWQFAAATQGWRQAHGGQAAKAPAPSDEAFDRMLATWEATQDKGGAGHGD